MSIPASSRAFDPKVVFGLLLFGALAFVATLYFIGTGQTSNDSGGSAAHGSGKGLDGYAAMAQFLEEEGHEVSISRSPGRLKDPALLIVTPPSSAEANDISAIINDRRYIGPTIVILPKWYAVSVQPTLTGDSKKGWVALVGSGPPDWVSSLDAPFDSAASIAAMPGAAAQWSGLGRSGMLPDPSQVMSVADSDFQALVSKPNGDVLVGYVQDGEPYPALDDAAGVARPSQSAPEAEYDEYGYRVDYDTADPDAPYYNSKWPVIFVAEPDLFNNYGFANPARADLAHEIVDLAMNEEDLPVIFDLTLNGLGSTQNLLTLAITPPFLAATLCLLLAMIVTAWRAFRRFGPAVTEGRAIAFGKAQLVRNSAGFIQRSRRLHLLSEPYADMVRERIVRALALRNPDDAAIESVLAKRFPQAPSYQNSAANLRNATTPNDILRAAAALKSLERMITK